MSLVALPVPVDGESPAVMAPRFQGQPPREVEFLTANEDVEVTHELERTPLGFLLIGLVPDVPGEMTVYNGSAAPTESTFTLRSSAPGAALVLFV